MSANKNKYFRVTTTKIVSAPNKSDAQEVARRTRSALVEVSQISAAAAREATA